MQFASNCFKPKTDPIPFHCIAGSPGEVIKHGGHELVEGTILSTCHPMVRLKYCLMRKD
jgi:hypothetical protein